MEIFLKGNYNFLPQLPFVDLPFPDAVPLDPPPPPPVEDVEDDLSWATDELVSLAWLPPPPSKLKQYKIRKYEEGVEFKFTFNG